MGLQFESRAALQAPANASGPVEVRFRVRELRSEKRGEETYLTGYAAQYNVLSDEMLGPKNKVWQERIMPGFFARALREGQDIRHLQNHDPNLVLGRTKAGTTVLREDSKGLAFETRLGNRSYERDLAESVDRGDVNEMSFGFVACKERWVEERGVQVRELIDGDLIDISTVTYPAYPGTSAGIDSRAMFPQGVPVELRSRLAGPTAAGGGTPAAVARAREIRGGVARGEFRSADAGGVLELAIYDEIGQNWWGDGITAKAVKAALDQSSAPTVRLRINSVGGDLFEAVAIYNVLRSQGKTVECCVDGLAASAASLVAMAGDKITMNPGTMMMVHCCSNLCWGNATELRAVADLLDVQDGSIAEIYAAKTGMAAAAALALMEAETWMGREECKAKGFCTDLAEPEKQDEDAPDALAAAAERSAKLLATYRSVPAQVAAAVGRRETQRTEERRMRLRLAQVS